MLNEKDLHEIMGMYKKVGDDLLKYFSENWELRPFYNKWDEHPCSYRVRRCETLDNN